jgi:hypothetical protein|tara:strand:- start:5690 stop:6013 length:324 start_codon:yes stop_codon:yes gene_type:complete
MTIKRSAPITKAEVTAVINSTAYVAKVTYVNTVDPVMKIIIADEIPSSQEEIIRQCDISIGGYHPMGTPATFEQASEHVGRDTRQVDAGFSGGNITVIKATITDAKI